MRRHRYDLDESGAAEFHANHEGYPDVVERFQGDLAEPLATIFRTHPDYACEELTVFTEYFGPNSFAGLHKPRDPKQLVLFDVQTDRGLVPPAKFVEDFASLPIARVVYRGKLTGKFATDIREGAYDVDEGVVCKGGDAPEDVWMVKIKTNRYLARLQAAFREDWEAYWE